MIVKKISAEDTIAIRHPVLRKGRPRQDCYFKGDDAPTTFHLGCFVDHQLAGVATFMQNKHELIEGNQIQLRGMAVLEAYQGKGLGKKILDKAEKIAISQGYTILWCNARITAVLFYEKLNYQTIGKPFRIEPIGIHYIMKKVLL